MENFFVKFLGTPDLLLFAVTYIWALLGLFSSLGVSVKNRDKGSIATPQQFDLRFFLMDNAERIARNAVVLLAMCRFHTEAYGSPIDSAKAFLLGLAFDRAYAVLKALGKKARA